MSSSQEASPGREPWLSWALAAAALAFVPFARPMLLGESFFFRDLSRTFFPVKRFVAEGLRRGEVRFWNPLLHEGVPLHLGPLSYPVDLLHALRVDEGFFSLMLATHLPLAAFGFALLARELGCAGMAAFTGAVLYTLGGFSLSCVNLYVYAQAMAWAPFVALGLLRVSRCGGANLAWAALAVWLCASTSGIEIFLQAIAIGLLLAERGDPGARLRSLAAVMLGVGLAAPALFVSAAQLAGSARATGLPAAVVAAHSVDPWTLPQVVIANWHGDLGNVVNRWWGSNFFPLGFPYFVSLYLGAAALSIALLGVGREGRCSRRLAALALLALLLCLGRFVGLEAVVSALPIPLLLRFPVKAFFTVHFVVALLAALGAERLRRGGGWGGLALLSAPLGSLLVAAPLVPAVAPRLWAWFLGGFMPLEHGWAQRAQNGDRLLADAATGGGIALLLAGVAALVRAGRLQPGRGVAAASALLGADLIRSGAGLNPTVSAGFFRLSPEIEEAIAAVRERGARVYSCDPEASPSYFQAQSLHANHDAWSFAVSVETLTPNLNMSFGIKTALSRDLTMMVPEARVVPPEETGAGGVARLLDRLRRAGVQRVLCTDPIEHATLRPASELRPPRIAPLSVYVYDVEGSLPSREVVGASGRILNLAEAAGWLRLDVSVAGPAQLVVRDAWAEGWRASVDGVPVSIQVSEGHYRSVPVTAGEHTVEMRYRPPGLIAGMAVACVCALALAGIARLRPSTRGYKADTAH